MTVTRSFKLSFTGGEISPGLAGRADLRAYENGARRLENVVVLPTGGLTRRPGTRFLGRAPGPARLAAFEFNSEQTYLLVFSDLLVEIYRTQEGAEGVSLAKVSELATPWGASQLEQLSWAQTADTMLVVHSEVAPKQLVRLAGNGTGGESWALEDWTFETLPSNASRQLVPYRSFGPGEGARFVLSRLDGGRIVLRGPDGYFNPGHEGVVFEFGTTYLRCTHYIGPQTVQVVGVGGGISYGLYRDLLEPAFSDARGWPAAVAIYRDRLVVGGVRDLPHVIWMSKVSDLFNFDFGTGLDDEAIEFALFSEQVNAVRALFVGRHLQVFTSGGEWMVTGSPLTPANVEARRQTRHGSPVEIALPPRDVDGATLFIERGRARLREFLFTDVEQAYQAADLSLLAPQMVSGARDLDYDSGRRLLLVVNGDGTLACLSQYRAEEVTAWAHWTTDGEVLALAYSGADLFLLVEREGGFFLEVLDDSLALDSGLSGEVAAPSDSWSGLDHLEGQEVQLLGDGRFLGQAAVEAGSLALEEPVSELRAGLAFTSAAEPLALQILGQQALGYESRYRAIELSFRLLESAGFGLDLGRGLERLDFGRFDGAPLDGPASLFTGDKTFRALGWREARADLCRRIARRVLAGQAADPFPAAIHLRHRDARPPAGCRELGRLGDFVFYAEKEDSSPCCLP